MCSEKSKICIVSGVPPSLLSYSDPLQARQTTQLALLTDFYVFRSSDLFQAKQTTQLALRTICSIQLFHSYSLGLPIQPLSVELLAPAVCAPLEPRPCRAKNNQPYPSGNLSWCPPTGTTWPTLTDDGPPPLAPRPTQMSLSNGRPLVGGTNYPMGQAQYGHENQPNQLSPTSEVRRPPHSSAASSLGPIRTHFAGVTHRALATLEQYFPSNAIAADPKTATFWHQVDVDLQLG
ncbi:hypothetical protein PCANC_02608 [Puccinia coronata f. sp. avenae]|uniref:Uncharacterized protein n=1 Tax=Puccinia coronata f. sp. avenae TaxID=200324 RepID=A0A2N5W5M0_9BASI|nr:hypothetical protein PCANC_02608 [Puccinia coronata f. sp. avenae]